ncbi:alpha/beta hydrolase [Rhodanobacter sp. C01]|uniref:alpha/beta fold hydrolase n=1 Tax=Rhodanobacter sp. C01 TaxID=1945856 RepID=UPI0020C3BDCB|nr:alpha/beta hydrolase [Rhodanobacter sp. C01]
MNRKSCDVGRAAMFAALISVVSMAAAGDVVPPQRIPDSYAQPGTLVPLARGRQLNLRCTGSGPRTVMLEAGSHTDSTTWFRLQPLLAASAKVCSYDRAGYGFSSAGPLPRDLDADVSDLHDLVHHAGLKTPLVLVGQSLGSNIARRYAQQYPADISGLVLIDPPAQDIAAFAPDWARDETAMNARRFDFIRQCEAGAEKHALASPPPELRSCVAGGNPLASDKVNAATADYKSKPAFWRTLLSELQDNDVAFGQPVSPDEKHGSLPLVVLTAANTYAEAPQAVRKSLEAARNLTQAKIVATSTRGERLSVDNTSHDIQLDQPQMVAEAVIKVLHQTGTVTTR